MTKRSCHVTKKQRDHGDDGAGKVIFLSLLGLYSQVKGSMRVQISSIPSMLSIGLQCAQETSLSKHVGGAFQVACC